jgi:hypothetical protein
MSREGQGRGVDGGTSISFHWALASPTWPGASPMATSKTWTGRGTRIITSDGETPSLFISSMTSTKALD